MLASGLPIRNGNKHATEICTLALSLLEATHNLPITHLPGQQLCMRVGIHSGPCVAGVTGLKMPRYLLFGETVEMAAKMESGGQPMKIHVSQATRSITEKAGFVFEKTGNHLSTLTGKIPTYWLLGTNTIN